MTNKIENTEQDEKGYKLSFFQKAALSAFVNYMKKVGIKTVVLSPDDKEENGLKMEFFVKPVKVLTVDELNELKSMVIL